MSASGVAMDEIKLPGCAGDLDDGREIARANGNSRQTTLGHFFLEQRGWAASYDALDAVIWELRREKQCLALPTTPGLFII